MVKGESLKPRHKKHVKKITVISMGVERDFASVVETFINEYKIIDIYYSTTEVDGDVVHSAMIVYKE